MAWSRHSCEGPSGSQAPTLLSRTQNSWLQPFLLENREHSAGKLSARVLLLSQICVWNLIFLASPNFSLVNIPNSALLLQMPFQRAHPAWACGFLVPQYYPAPHISHNNALRVFTHKPSISPLNTAILTIASELHDKSEAEEGKWVTLPNVPGAREVPSSLVIDEHIEVNSTNTTTNPFPPLLPKFHLLHITQSRKVPSNMIISFSTLAWEEN